MCFTIDLSSGDSQHQPKFEEVDDRAHDEGHAIAGIRKSDFGFDSGFGFQEFGIKLSATVNPIQ
jgi:hypothetical protein